MLWLLFHMLLYNYIIGPLLFQYFCHFFYLVYIGSYIYKYSMAITYFHS